MITTFEIIIVLLAGLLGVYLKIVSDREPNEEIPAPHNLGYHDLTPEEQAQFDEVKGWFEE